jgi:hypothetical protein
MRRLVNADCKQERDQLEHYVDVLQGHARLVSILTRGPAIPRALGRTVVGRFEALAQIMNRKIRILSF